MDHQIRTLRREKAELDRLDYEASAPAFVRALHGFLERQAIQLHDHLPHAVLRGVGHYQEPNFRDVVILFVHCDAEPTREEPSWRIVDRSFHPPIWQHDLRITPAAPPHLIFVSFWVPGLHTVPCTIPMRLGDHITTADETTRAADRVADFSSGFVVTVGPHHNEHWVLSARHCLVRSRTDTSPTPATWPKLDLGVDNHGWFPASNELRINHGVFDISHYQSQATICYFQHHPSHATSKRNDPVDHVIPEAFKDLGAFKLLDHSVHAQPYDWEVVRSHLLAECHHGTNHHQRDEVIAAIEGVTGHDDSMHGDHVEVGDVVFKNGRITKWTVGLVDFVVRDPHNRSVLHAIMSHSLATNPMKHQCEEGDSGAVFIIRGSSIHFLGVVSAKQPTRGGMLVAPGAAARAVLIRFPPPPRGSKRDASGSPPAPDPPKKQSESVVIRPPPRKRR